MARRVELETISCPENTPQATPVEVLTPFDPGIVVKVTIVIPDGHAGLTGITLAVAHQPIIPKNRRAVAGEAWKYLEGNDEVIPFDLDGYPESGAWSAWLYNTDEVPHSWQIRFEVDEYAQPVAIATTSPLSPTEIEQVGAPPETSQETSAGGELSTGEPITGGASPSEPVITPVSEPPAETETPATLTPIGTEPEPPAAAGEEPATEGGSEPLAPAGEEPTEGGESSTEPSFGGAPVSIRASHRQKTTGGGHQGKKAPVKKTVKKRKAPAKHAAPPRKTPAVHHTTPTPRKAPVVHHAAPPPRRPPAPQRATVHRSSPAAPKHSSPPPRPSPPSPRSAPPPPPPPAPRRAPPPPKRRR
jgi:hypothetical protein